MKTKIIIFILFVLILCRFGLVYAEDAEVIVSSKEAQAEDIIEVEISLRNNPGIVAAMFSVSYDTKRLTLLSAEDKHLLEGGTFSKDYSDMPYVLLWNSASSIDFTADGVLAILKFKVSDTAQSGRAFINLTYETDNVYDVEFNNVLFNIQNGFVNIKNNSNAYTSKNELSRPSSTESTDAIPDKKALNYESKQIVFTVNQRIVNIFGDTIEIDVSPILKNDRVMLPIRYVAEFLGAQVLWKETSPNNGEVVILKDDNKIQFIIGEYTMLKNGKTYNMDTCPFIEKGRTYIPMRFAAEALDAKVEWNDKTNQVIIFK